jgi:hypothetical protein
LIVSLNLAPQMVAVWWLSTSSDCLYFCLCVQSRLMMPSSAPWTTCMTGQKEQPTSQPLTQVRTTSMLYTSLPAVSMMGCWRQCTFKGSVIVIISSSSSISVTHSPLSHRCHMFLAHTVRPMLELIWVPLLGAFILPMSLAHSTTTCSAAVTCCLQTLCGRCLS